MKNLNYVQALVMSFFSRVLYREVGRRWRGTGFAYLFLLVALCLITPVVRLNQKLSAGLKDEAVQGIIQQIPEIKIVDGRASTSVAQPYYIREPKTEKVLAVIDTTGQTQSLSPDVYVLLTAERLIYRQSKTETRSNELVEIKNFTLNQEMVNGFLAVFKRLFAPIFYIFAVPALFCVRIIQVLIYAGLATFFSGLTRVRLDYPVLLRLAAVAISPALIIGTVREALGVEIPFWPLFGFLITMAYLFFAASSNTLEDAASPLEY